jgi:signal transduction histidine kinase
MMNIGAMAAVTLIILAEKTLSWHRLAPYTVAFALVIYGALVIASPELLPTFQKDVGAPVTTEMQVPRSTSASKSSAMANDRWQSSVILLIVIAQAAIVALLLYERRRRRHAEVQNTRRVAELAHINRLNVAGELTATIAHELSQPLVAILANSAVARELLNSPVPNLTEVREILANIERDDQRATDVIHRLRSFLKKAPVERRDNDLNKLARETIELLSGLATAREIELIGETFSGELPIKCDHVQLEQVIVNLIVNAMDAMSALPLAKRRIVVMTLRVEDFAEVAVSDTGPGVPADALETVFQPFFTTKAQGMGMGLSIARSIIEDHDGRIWASNQHGGGSVFHVRLPLSKTAL